MSPPTLPSKGTSSNVETRGRFQVIKENQAGPSYCPPPVSPGGMRISAQTQLGTLCLREAEAFVDLPVIYSN